MKKYKKLILSAVGFAIFIIIVFISAYSLGKHFSLKTVMKEDELLWLKKEFKLSNEEYERIKKLHEGYKPICSQMCIQIAQKKSELYESILASTSMSSHIENLLHEIGMLRAKCQANMFKYFFDVSSNMPPEQGKRYLEMMSKIVIGDHERIEQSMSSEKPSKTGHVH